MFLTPEAGFRALAKTLLTYRSKHRLRTVQGIINRWAPPHENVTSAYVREVAKALGVEPSEPIDVRNFRTLSLLAKAIARHENGGHYWADQVIHDGVRQAGIAEA